MRYLLAGAVAGVLASVAVLPSRVEVSLYIYNAQAYTGTATYAVDAWVNGGEHGGVLRWCNRSPYDAGSVIQSFEGILPNYQWLENCDSFDVQIDTYVSGLYCGAGVPGCNDIIQEYDPQRGGHYITYAFIWLNQQEFYFEPDGARAVIAHELGHVHGLYERYDPGPPPVCGPDNTVMNATVGEQRGDQVWVVSGCQGVVYPTSTDTSWIQDFYALNPAGNLRILSQGQDYVFWQWDDNNWAESSYWLQFFRSGGGEVDQLVSVEDVWHAYDEATHFVGFYPGALDPPQSDGYYYMCSYTYSYLQGFGGYVCTDPVWLTLTPPPPPSVGLSGSNGNGTVTWGAVSDATYYNVHVGRWNGGGYIDVVEDDDTASPYYFQYPISDFYHAGVQACNAHGCSGWTASDPWWVTLAPGTPSISSVQTISSNQLRVSWNWGNPEGNYVQVERKTGTGGTYSDIGWDDVSPLDNVDLSPGTTYCYRIRAFTGSTGAYSGYSSERCGTTSSGTPATPTISSVQTLGSTSLRVNWAWGSPQGNFVAVDRKVSGGSYSYNGSDELSPYDSSGLSSNTTYCYRMRACYDSQHCSGYSNERCGTTAPSAPGTVGISGSNGNGSVTWSNVSGATSYRVHVGRWNNGSYLTVIDNAYDTASPYNFSYSVADNYHAGVRACSSAGCSDWTASNPWWVWLSTPPPAAPTNVTITQNYGSSYGVRLCWTDNSSNEAKFQVRAFAYWNNATCSWDVNPNTTCFNAVFFADAWHFCVRSVGAGGESYHWVSVTKPTNIAVYYVNVPCSQTYCQNAGNTNNDPHPH